MCVCVCVYVCVCHRQWIEYIRNFIKIYGSALCMSIVTYLFSFQVYITKLSNRADTVRLEGYPNFVKFSSESFFFRPRISLYSPSHPSEVDKQQIYIYVYIYMFVCMFIQAFTFIYSY